MPRCRLEIRPETLRGGADDARDFLVYCAALSLNPQSAMSTLDRNHMPTLRGKANAGDAEAQFYCGLHHFDTEYLWRKERGIDDATSAEAEKWFRLAAEQGSPVAQSNLGLMYKYGWGVPELHKEANKWFDLAAEQGDAEAQYQLSGGSYSSKSKESWEFLRSAARQGHLRAQYSIAYRCYRAILESREDKDAFHKNMKEGIKQIRTVAEKGQHDAQYWLAELSYGHWENATTSVMSSWGDMLKEYVDHKEAYIWYSIYVSNEKTPKKIEDRPGVKSPYGPDALHDSYMHANMNIRSIRSGEFTADELSDVQKEISQRREKIKSINIDWKISEFDYIASLDYSAISRDYK